MSVIKLKFLDKSQFLTRLAHDRSGNVLAMMAAALFPLLALLGGGIDMGRGYLSQTRLQQACDAGVLAARKRLGTVAAVSGVIPNSVADTGHKFFNFNFQDGDYGTENRAFDMTLEEDFTVTGDATVDVPTTLMALFGYSEVPVSVSCSAQLNLSNTDIMMVLDVTGSMANTNAGDSDSRIDVLKTTVLSFYEQLSQASSTSARLRFGFVPYSTNVNVGSLLQDSWMVDDWEYQSRELSPAGEKLGTRVYTRNWLYVSGDGGSSQILSTYAATFHPGTPGTETVDENENVIIVGATPDYYTCDQAPPPSTLVSNYIVLSTESFPFPGPPVGTQTVETREVTSNGTSIWSSLSGQTCTVYQLTRTNYIETYEYVTEPTLIPITNWHYDQLPYDVRNWRVEGNGCIEERDTYLINDYDNVDLSRAKDLDIDLVPTADNATRWRPAYPNYVYARSMLYSGTGSFTSAEVTTDEEYIAPTAIGTAACPAAARKLDEMTAAQVGTYLDTLTPGGATYHDIGMIWGGRLLSPTGIFAAENADSNATQPSSRHMIFLTDGETEPLDIAYSSYGLEPIDGRRWTESSALSLAETVEKRFSFACEEVKKRNIQVWVISFGTDANDAMQQCAGADRYFVADDAASLAETFGNIARKLGALRVTG